MDKTYKGIFLDLDNTLYDYEAAHQPAKEAVVNHYAKKFGLEPEILSRLYDDCRGTFNDVLHGTAASHNRLLYFQSLCERLDINPLPHALDSFELYWKIYIENIKLFEGVLTFLGNNQHKKIVIISDLTAYMQHKKLIAIGLSDMITHLVTSEEVGIEKPAAAMFETALEKAELKPEDVCMIGDNYEKDIVGAERMGIDSFWLNRTDHTRQVGKSVKEVKQFSELLELI